MTRLTLIRLLLAAACISPAFRTAGQHGCHAAEDAADLASRLTTGLRVQAPDDVAFCERVAWLVRKGKLPAGLVDSTYTWAIGRGKKYPFPAFQHVIRLQATKLGVSL